MQPAECEPVSTRLAELEDAAKGLRLELALRESAVPVARASRLLVQSIAAAYDPWSPGASASHAGHVVRSAKQLHKKPKQRRLRWRRKGRADAASECPFGSIPAEVCVSGMFVLLDDTSMWSLAMSCAHMWRAAHSCGRLRHTAWL